MANGHRWQKYLHGARSPHKGDRREEQNSARAIRAMTTEQLSPSRSPLQVQFRLNPGGTPMFRALLAKFRVDLWGARRVRVQISGKIPSVIISPAPRRRLSPKRLRWAGAIWKNRRATPSFPCRRIRHFLHAAKLRSFAGAGAALCPPPSLSLPP